jgi:hypothetical protein
MLRHQTVMKPRLGYLIALLVGAAVAGCTLYTSNDSKNLGPQGPDAAPYVPDAYLYPDAHIFPPDGSGSCGSGSDGGGGSGYDGGPCCGSGYDGGIFPYPDAAILPPDAP